MAVVVRRIVGVGALVAMIGGGFVAWATYRAWRYPCVSDRPGLRGEVMPRDGKLLYHNGKCWTAQPMPPRDMPF